MPAGALPAVALPGTARAPAPIARSRQDDARLRSLVEQNHTFIWRALRRLGVPQADADDAAQHVFVVAARRLAEIEPGKERSFLFGTALRVASEHRRTIARRREAPAAVTTELDDPRPDPEQLAEQASRRALLDALLGELGLELRTVFVLFEIEELSAPQIASLLEIPAGTVASRLRRAREEFHAAVRRWRARESFERRTP